MRDIKFRIFENNEMSNLNCLYLPHVEENIKLMQFTGLFDKNDVEIYEGDLIILAIEENVYSEPLEVSYSEISACFIIGNKYRFTAMNEVEVVGNIYQNTKDKKCYSCIHLEANSYCVNKDVSDSDTPKHILFTGCGLIQTKGKIKCK